MATLRTRQFVFEPDMVQVHAHCDEIARRNPALKKDLMLAFKDFENAKDCLNKNHIEQAFNLFRASIERVFNSEANELLSSCFFYLGFIGFAFGDSEMGINCFHSALYKTGNAHLAISLYNRLMIHYLSSQQFAEVLALADKTKELASKLPDESRRYHTAAADYSRAEVYFRKEEYADVLPHIKSAIAGFESLSLVAETAKSRGMLGNAQIILGDVDRGLANTEASLADFRRLQNEQEIAFLLQGRGLAMAKQERLSEAIADLRQAARIFRQSREINALNATLAVVAALEAQST